MIIHHARRWVYLGVPKTGSTTMHLLLSRPPFDGENVYGMGNEQQRAWPQRPTMRTLTPP